MDSTFKIVLLCHNHSNLSRQCLEGLLELDNVFLCAGLFDPARDDWQSSLQRSIRSGSVLHNLRILAGSTLRSIMRRLGFSLRRPATVKEFLISENVPWFPVNRVNSEKTRQRLVQENPDLLVIATFPQILRGHILSIPRLGCINTHPSLLPRYRGPLPVYWVLKNGEPKTGVTIHFVDEGIDTGDIICQKEILIEPGENPGSLSLRLGLLARILLKETVLLFRDGHDIPRLKQDEDSATYLPNPYN